MSKRASKTLVRSSRSHSTTGIRRSCGTSYRSCLCSSYLCAIIEATYSTGLKSCALSVPCRDSRCLLSRKSSRNGRLSTSITWKSKTTRALTTKMPTQIASCKSYTSAILCRRSNSLSSFSISATLSDSGGTLSCLLYTSPSPRDLSTSRMPSSA